MNEIGRPLTSVSSTSFQSSSVVFSTIAQPCRNGGLLVLQHQPVAGLPDRRLLDVAHPDLARALAEEIERDGLLVGDVAVASTARALRNSPSSFSFASLMRLTDSSGDRPQTVVGQQVEHLDLEDLGPWPISCAASRRRR